MQGLYCLADLAHLCAHNSLLFLRSDRPAIDLLQEYLRAALKFRGASLVLASVHRARQSFLCRFLFDLCLVSVQLLRNLELAFLDEINTICGTTSLSVDLLASDKLTWLHRLEDGLQGVTSEFGEDAEAAEKRNNLLELTLFLFLDGPLEVLG